MVVVVPAKEHCAKDHRHSPKTGEGGRDVSLLVQRKAEFNKVQCAVAVQRPFNDLECGCFEAAHGSIRQRPCFNPRSST